MTDKELETLRILNERRCTECGTVVGIMVPPSDGGGFSRFEMNENCDVPLGFSYRCKEHPE